jgi:carboxyl-terminal processing protease
MRSTLVTTSVVVGFALVVAACSPSATEPVIADPGPSSTVSVAPTASTMPASNPPTTAPPSTARPVPVLAVEAEMYLDDAIDLMRRWSINRDEVDWVALEELAFRVADGAETPADTHSALRSAMNLLHDGHSVFLAPSQADTFATGPAAFDEPVVELREDRIGYVAIGRYSGDIGDQADAYATALASNLSGTTSATCGWIVDLRTDSGGNMWPMIGGLAPLIGAGHVGSFVYPDGTIENWTLENGTAYWDGEPMTAYAAEVSVDGPPIAVLVGTRTGSSGEATATAFHGRPDTRFFGQPTAGLTTSNEPLALSDGALLILTMSVFTDRNGVSYGQDISIEPDVLVDGDPTAEATAWLLDHPGCGQ